MVISVSNRPDTILLPSLPLASWQDTDTVGEFKKRLPTVGYANGSGDGETLA